MTKGEFFEKWRDGPMDGSVNREFLADIDAMLASAVSRERERAYGEMLAFAQGSYDASRELEDEQTADAYKAVMEECKAEIKKLRQPPPHDAGGEITKGETDGR